MLHLSGFRVLNRAAEPGHQDLRLPGRTVKGQGETSPPSPKDRAVGPNPGSAQRTKHSKLQPFRLPVLGRSCTSLGFLQVDSSGERSCPVL